MYEGIYSTIIRSLCMFIDIFTVCYTFIHFFNIKYEHSITLRAISYFQSFISKYISFVYNQWLNVKSFHLLHYSIALRTFKLSSLGLHLHNTNINFNMLYNNHLNMTLNLSVIYQIMFCRYTTTPL